MEVREGRDDHAFAEIPDGQAQHGLRQRFVYAFYDAVLDGDITVLIDGQLVP